MHLLPITLVPLAFAALLLLHPTGADTFSELVASDPDRWLAIHVGAAVLFPATAGVVWILLRGLAGRAATVARVSLLVFAVGYTAFEVLTGIATGLLVQESEAMSPTSRADVADVVNTIATHPIAGEFGAFNTLGALGWMAAIGAGLLALRAAGVRTSALALFGAGVLMVTHVPPIGPFALVCLCAAGVMIETQLRPRPRAQVAPAAS